MAGQVKQSGLVAKYGAKLDRAVRAHADDQTKYGIINLPPGITNGIARLVECKFDTYKDGANKGEYYFRAAGVVISPKSVTQKDGTLMPVQGLQTSIMEAMCDTKTQAGKEVSMDEHLANVLNHMRKLGAETTGAGAADLEVLAASLKEAAPYFRFTTSPRKDMQTGEVTGAWENWNGVKGLEDYDPDADGGGDGVDDATEEVAETVDVVEKPKPAPPAKPGAPKPGPGKVKKEPTLAELGAKADDGDEAASTELTNKAYEVGFDDKAITAAENWVAMAEQIQERIDNPSLAHEEPTDDEGGEDWKPAKEDVYKYAPPGPGGKKGKPVECEVTAVNTAKKTVELKNLASKAKYTNIAWTDLIQE